MSVFDESDEYVEVHREGRWSHRVLTFQAGHRGWELTWRRGPFSHRRAVKAGERWLRRRERLRRYREEGPTVVQREADR